MHTNYNVSKNINKKRGGYKMVKNVTIKDFTDITADGLAKEKKNVMNITVRRSRLSGVARATNPDKQSHLILHYCAVA